MKRPMLRRFDESVMCGWYYIAVLESACLLYASSPETLVRMLQERRGGGRVNMLFAWHFEA